MQIYLLRHGIAEDAKPGQPDTERALTDEGRDKLRRVLKRARTADLDPSLILASPYRRAIETAAVAAEVLAYKGEIVRTRALVPEASPYDAWEEIRNRKNERAILLSSHEPLMSSLVAFLLDSPALRVEMKKAALVRVDCDRFGPKAAGVLKWMLTPGVCLE
jgi:phosphohistidine phosphatase